MRAPDSKGLFLMLVIYGSVVFIIFLIARFTGKTQGSWVLVGAIALIMSSYIALTKDSMINVPNENKELSMIYKPAVDLSVNEKVYALYQHAKGKILYKNDSAGNYIVNLSTGQKLLDLSSSIGFNMVNNGPKKTEVNIENLSVNFLKLTNKSNKQSLEETEIDAETWRNFAVWSETNSTSKSIPIKIRTKV